MANHKRTLRELLPNGGDHLACIGLTPTSKLSADEHRIFDLIVSARPTFEWQVHDRLLITRLARWLVKSEKWSRECKDLPMLTENSQGTILPHPAHDVLNKLDLKISRALRELHLAGADRINSNDDTGFHSAGARRLLAHNMKHLAQGDQDDDLLA